MVVPATPMPRHVEALGAADIRALICAQPWPCEQAIRVAFCESSLSPAAVSPDGANFGLFQINRVHAGKVGGNLASLLDAATNIRVAVALWRDQGWGPWSCKP